MNIHSHLLGAVLFLTLLATFPAVHFTHYESTTWTDVVMFTIFLSASVFCLFSSAFYHTFSAHSQEVRHKRRTIHKAQAHGNRGIMHRLPAGAMHWTTRESWVRDSWVRATETYELTPRLPPVLIVGSFFPCIYYGFYCDPTYQLVYLSGLTIMGAGMHCVACELLWYRASF